MAAWFYAKGAKRHGPVDLDVLVSSLQRGELTLADKAWSEGMPRWSLIRDVPELVEASGLTPTDGTIEPPPLDDDESASRESAVANLWRRFSKLDVGLTVAGALGSLVSLALIFGAASVAEAFLGASTMGGMPWGKEDAVKMAIVRVSGFTCLIFTLPLLFAGGISLFTNSPPTQEPHSKLAKTAIQSYVLCNIMGVFALVAGALVKRFTEDESEMPPIVVTFVSVALIFFVGSFIAAVAALGDKPKRRILAYITLAYIGMNVIGAATVFLAAPAAG